MYAFKRSVSRFWEFEALDVMFIQPRRAYIEDWLDDDLVQGYIDKDKNAYNMDCNLKYSHRDFCYRKTRQPR
jgi:hypothetical protein